MIRVKLTLQTLQTLLHTNPSHQNEPFQSELLMLTASQNCSFNILSQSFMLRVNLKTKLKTLLFSYTLQNAAIVR